MDTIRYESYSEHEHYNILYDKLDKTYAIHSKNLKRDTVTVVNFKTAAKAIEFAENRIVNIHIEA